LRGAAALCGRFVVTTSPSPLLRRRSSAAAPPPPLLRAAPPRRSSACALASEVAPQGRTSVGEARLLAVLHDTALLALANTTELGLVDAVLARTTVITLAAIALATAHAPGSLVASAGQLLPRLTSDWARCGDPHLLRSSGSGEGRDCGGCSGGGGAGSSSLGECDERLGRPQESSRVIGGCAWCHGKCRGRCDSDGG